MNFILMLCFNIDLTKLKLLIFICLYLNRFCENDYYINNICLPIINNLNIILYMNTIH